MTTRLKIVQIAMIEESADGCTYILGVADDGGVYSYYQDDEEMTEKWHPLNMEMSLIPDRNREKPPKSHG